MEEQGGDWEEWYKVNCPQSTNGVLQMGSTRKPTSLRGCRTWVGGRRGGSLCCFQASSDESEISTEILAIRRGDECRGEEYWCPVHHSSGISVVLSLLAAECPELLDLSLDDLRRVLRARLDHGLRVEHTNADTIPLR